MADLFSKINVLIRAGINDAANSLTAGGNPDQPLPTPAEVTGDSDSAAPASPAPSASTSAPKPPSEAARAAARTDEKLDVAISMLQQRFLSITTEMNELDKQIDAALLDNNDDVARQLTRRLQDQQRQAQQIADDMARYNIPLPPAPREQAAPPAPQNPPATATIPVSSPASSFRVPVRTNDVPAAKSTPTASASTPTSSPAPTAPSAAKRPMNEVLTDKPAVPDSDAKLAERRRRLSLPD